MEGDRKEGRRMQKVSVIVPVYQAEKFIHKCVQSIINQTYQNLEILLIDDGSLDNSLKLCNEFQEQDSRIRVIHQKNRGVSATRNRGIREAAGEYILFVDADDIIENNMIEYMIQKAIETESKIVICGFDYVYEDRIEKQIPIDKEGEYSREYIYTNFWEFYKAGIIHNIGNKLYSKKLLKDNQILFNESRPVLEDVQFCLDAIKMTDSIYICKDNFYKYIMQANLFSAQKRYRKNFYLSLQEVFEYIHGCGIERSKDFYLVYMDAILLTLKNEMYRGKGNYKIILSEYENICNLTYVSEASKYIKRADVRVAKYIFYLAIWSKKLRLLFCLVYIWCLEQKNYRKV